MKININENYKNLKESYLFSETARRIREYSAKNPDKKVITFAKDYNNFGLYRDPVEACAGADVIFTDVWASMGQEEEAAERRKVFEGIYQINKKCLGAANPSCMVQHCLPAHRGEEITEEIFEAHADEIFDEAENRLHAQKAVMVALMERK